MTVAVLACGIDVPYPMAHRNLLNEIAREGLVISEYPPGVLAAKPRFLQRNRLIAALSEVTVVIEAGHRSGARNTAKWARQLGRRALAVPGSVESATSVGCNAMIREGEATLVTCASEVIGDAAPMHLPFGSDDVSPEEAAVTAALPAGGAGADAERIALRSGVDVSRVRAILPVLELRGTARVNGLRWRRARRADAV